MPLNTGSRADNAPVNTGSGVDIEKALAEAERENPRAGAPFSPADAYAATAGAAARQVQWQTGRIAELVAALGSEAPAARAEAARKLREEIDLDFGYDPAGTDSANKQPLAEWTAYVKNLDEAVTVKIPQLITRDGSPGQDELRASAAKFLGNSAPHPEFVKLLETVATNQKEALFVRQKAIEALAQIPHDGLIPFLIDQLQTPAGREARHQLRVLTGRAGGGIGESPPPEWGEQEYRQWWEKNKDTFVYDRQLTLRPY